MHVLPQSIPDGVEDTEPEPVPPRDRQFVAVTVNVAVTDFAAVIVTEQVFVPVHAPDQPVNVEPAAGIALNTTVAPRTKVVVHVVPQSIPDGVDETDPEPVPARETDNA